VTPIPNAPQNPPGTSGHVNRGRARGRGSRGSPVGILLCLLISGYFGHHALYGRHGLEARARLTQRAARATVEIRLLDAQVQRLQRDVALLAREPPDADFVREIAVDVLGFVPTDGVIVVSPAVARAR
jgi:cell division protein FtsB